MSHKIFSKNLLSLERKDKRHYVLIKDFNTFMCNHSLQRETKQFRHYCLPVFSMEKILKCHTDDCFKTKDKVKLSHTIPAVFHN